MPHFFSQEIQNMLKRWMIALLVVGLFFWFSQQPGLGSEEELREASKLSEEVGQLYRAGRLKEALPPAQMALQIRYKNLGPEHPETAASLTKLGLLYQALGSTDEALPVLERALQIRYKAQGQDHPDTAASLHNLAELYRSAGAPDKALPLIERALRTREKVLGPEHPDTAASLNALGAYHQDRGEYVKGRHLYERALGIRERALPSNHPDTAVSLNNLGELHRLLGIYDKALMMHGRALQINERVYGSLHPSTSLSLSNLATLYHDMGFYSKARPLYERALQIRQKALGLEHLLTAQSLNNLAVSYQSQKEFDKAVPLYERAMAIREKSLPAGHPDLAASLHNLATLHRDMGQAAKALPLFEEALKMREQALGPDHPDTAVSLQQLAAFHQDLGSPGKAIPLYEQVLKIKEKTLGTDHPLTLASLNTLALAHRGAGEYNQALSLYSRGWKLREQALGPEHADTLNSLNTLAALYLDTAAYAKALSLYEQALKIKEKTPGPNHPDTALSLENVALVYQAMGEYDKALTLYERSLKIKETALNPEHVAVSQTLIYQASLFQDMGAYEKALSLAARAVAIREKAAGAEHPDTAVALENLGGLYVAMGRYAKALPLFERAGKIFEQSKGAGHLATVLSLHKLASLHQVLSDGDKAFKLYEQVAPVLEKALGPQHPETAKVFAQIGLAYASRGDQDKAGEYFSRIKSQTTLIDVALALGRYEEAWQLVDDLTPPLVSTPAFQIHYYIQRGRALAGIGLLPEAAVAFWQALQGVEKKSSRPLRNFLDFSETPENLLTYQGLVAVLTQLARTGGEPPPQLQEFGRNAQAAAFSLAEAAKARQVLAALARSPQKTGRADLPPELRQRLEILDFRLAANETQWEKATAGGKEGLQEAIENRKQLIAASEALTDELRLTQPLQAALYYPQTVPVRDIPLAGDEVIISYSVGESGSVIFVVRQDGVQYLHLLPMGRKELETLVREFMAPLLSGKPESFSLEQGRRLYDLLLAKPLATVHPDEQVIIVPDGILGLLPFETLVISAGSDPETSIFVGDQRTLQYYPAAAVLAQQRGRATNPPAHSLFGLGNPFYLTSIERPQTTPAKKSPPESPPRPEPIPLPTGLRTPATSPVSALIGTGETGTSEIRYPPLPATELLVRDLARLFGVEAEPPDVLLGQWANETRMRQSPLADYHHLFFGAHADLTNTVPGKLEPFLALGQMGNEPPDDGFLTLGEVFDLELGARLVTLAQGHTGPIKSAQGDGIIHLARAFQYAGARSVLVNLWEANPKVTHEFLGKMYGYLRTGKSSGEALRLARSDLRRAYPDPVFWAGFVMYGER